MAKNFSNKVGNISLEIFPLSFTVEILVVNVNVNVNVSVLLRQCLSRDPDR